MFILFLAGALFFNHSLGEAFLPKISTQSFYGPAPVLGFGLEYGKNKIGLGFDFEWKRYNEPSPDTTIPHSTYACNNLNYLLSVHYYIHQYFDGILSIGVSNPLFDNQGYGNNPEERYYLNVTPRIYFKIGIKNTNIRLRVGLSFTHIFGYDGVNNNYWILYEGFDCKLK